MRYTRSNVSISRGFNVPYCNKCGFQVNEEMQFCPNCGVQLKLQRSVHEKPASSAKSNNMPLLIPSTPFTHGIFIGLGAAILIGSLSGAFLLNANYWFLRGIFVGSGYGPQQISYTLSMTVSLIGFCALFAVIGVFTLAVGTLSQVNPTFRAAFNSGNMRARWGSGSLTMSFVLGGNSLRYLVESFYAPDSFRFWFTIILGIASIILFLIGFFFITKARPE
ncbi:MAG TPA: zinc ribbon domain-containing protein [Candidatus Bathyarchaeia archaeon]|nr:zinc ribbon domain-containing protein [Candidatus Bathyarchaeia archaeon]